MTDFKSFEKIENIGKLYMSITQKIHGSNAQIYIYENPPEIQDHEGKYGWKAGSRSRWLSAEDDNYGFWRFVEANDDDLIEALGPGRHFGEWAGPGINAGEGLSEKTFVLFNWRRWKEKQLPPHVIIVPVLYSGKMSFEAIEETMAHLKENGSSLVPGYMKPEGIVVEIGDNFYKKTFTPEEVEWKGIKKERPLKVEGPNITYLLQPIRLEKLLSRDERYIRDYPNTLPEICAAYTKDLEEEQQITGTEDEIKELRKALGKKIYPFIKAYFIVKEDK